MKPLIRYARAFLPAVLLLCSCFNTKNVTVVVDGGGRGSGGRDGGGSGSGGNMGTGGDPGTGGSNGSGGGTPGTGGALVGTGGSLGGSGGTGAGGSGTGGTIAGTGGRGTGGIGSGGTGTGGMVVGTGGRGTGGAGTGGAGTGGTGTGGAGTGGSTAGTGGTAPACTGAGVCGRSPTGIYCGRSNGANGFAAWSQWSDNYTDALGWKGSPSYWATIQFPDVTGDGRADVCGRAIAGIFCGVATGAGAFLAPTNWSDVYNDTNGFGGNPFYWGTIQFPDVTGDGKADVCGRGAAGITCAASTGVNGFGPGTLWTNNGFTDAGGWNVLQGYWGTIQFPDVNGDGKADVCGRGAGGVGCSISNGTDGFTASGSGTWTTFYSDNGGWIGSPSYWGTIQFPDINGDGKADICGRISDGVYCAISNGTNGFGPTTIWSSDFTNTGGWNTSQSYWATILFPDVNGDGKADICARGAGGVVCGISNGTSAFSAATVWAAQFSDAAGFNSDATLWGTIQFPDLNGDGKADICARTPSGVDCGLSNGTSGFAVARWLDQFTDANGWRTDLSYGATLQTPNLNPAGCAPATKRSTTSPTIRRIPPF